MERAAAGPPPLLETDGLAKSFGGVAALAGVSMTVRAGEIHALVGENGAGKSTLIKCWAGAVLPDRGLLRIGGESIVMRDPAQAERMGVRFVHQELNLEIGRAHV